MDVDRELVVEDLIVEIESVEEDLECDTAVVLIETFPDEGAGVFVVARLLVVLLLA